MLNISGFLQKFLSLEKSNDVKLAIILEVLKKQTGLELAKDGLEIKGDSLKLNYNSVFRNEIFMHRSEIESALKDQKIFLRIV